MSKDSAILFTGPTNLPWVEVRSGHRWHGPGADRGRSSSANSCSRGIECAAFEDRALSVGDHAAILEQRERPDSFRSTTRFTLCGR